MSDPNGDFIFMAVLAAQIAMGSSIFSGKATSVGAVLGAGALAAGTSLATGGIGSLFGSIGSVGNEIGRAGAHGFLGGISSELSGGSFGSGFLSGAFSSGFGSATSGLGGVGAYAGGAISGGVGSYLGGGNVLAGVGRGLLITALNHQSHGGPCDGCPEHPSIPYDDAPIISATRMPNQSRAALKFGFAFASSAISSAGQQYTTPTYSFPRNAMYKDLAKFRNSVYSKAANGIAYANLGVTAYDTYNGNASKVTLAGEVITTGIVTRAPFPYNVAWGIGWETGRIITNRKWYLDAVWGPGGRDGLMSTRR